MIQLIKLKTKIDLDMFAMACLCAEYDKLQHIPNFKVRIDTAINNAVATLNLIDGTVFQNSIKLLQTTKFYE